MVQYIYVKDKACIPKVLIGPGILRIKSNETRIVTFKNFNNNPLIFFVCFCLLQRMVVTWLVNLQTPSRCIKNCVVWEHKQL